MAFAAYIFDLDGTLLNTLPDLVRLTNMVLDQYGWPQRTQDEILSFVGDGGRALVRRAAPPDACDGEIEEAFERWQKLYPTYGHALTRPYDGIPEVLAKLKERGAKLGVLSNKFDAATQEVIAHHFPGQFDLVCGESEEIPRKPDPRGLRHMISLLGTSPKTVAFVGDSVTDIKVAHEAGVFPVGVAWGYRPVTELQAAGAHSIVSKPHDLLLL